MIANLVVSELELELECMGDVMYYGPLFVDIHVTSRHAHTTFYPFFCCAPFFTRLDVIHKTKISYRKSWRQSGD